MSIRIIPSEQQARGAFDDGRIQERKPIGFPQDGGQTAAYSTLFYWAHAWSKEGGFIAEHPHRGFEIMSVVLEGEIEHYDSAHEGWKKLSAGDVQVIHSGSGITHAEKILKNSSIFQIWFDPDLEKTLTKPANYKDFKSSLFPVKEDPESRTKLILGGTDLTLDAKVDYIQEIRLKISVKSYPIDKNAVYSFFILEGKMKISGQEAREKNFVIVEGEDILKLEEIQVPSRIFIIKTPLRPPYKTYAEMSLR